MLCTCKQGCAQPCQNFMKCLKNFLKILRIFCKISWNHKMSWKVTSLYRYLLFLPIPVSVPVSISVSISVPVSILVSFFVLVPSWLLSFSALWPRLRTLSFLGFLRSVRTGFIWWWMFLILLTLRFRTLLLFFVFFWGGAGWRWAWALPIVSEKWQIK